MSGGCARRARGHGLDVVCGLCLAGGLALVPAPVLPANPQLLTGPQAPKPPGDPLHVVLSLLGPGGGSQGRHSHSAKRGHLTGLSVGSLASSLCPPACPAQNTAPVIPATEGPYSRHLLLELVWG